VVHTAAWVFPITLVAVVAARDVVALLFTAEYDGATEVFRWYAVLTLGRIAWYAAPMLAAGEPQRVLRASWISLVVNAALSATFMLLLGAVGTAVGTAVAFLPTAFVYCSQGAKALGIRPTELFPTRAVATLLARGALAAAAAAAVRTLWPLSPGPALATSAAVLFVVWWALGLVRHPAASST
jgi:O-antigen/teichoic acid export membrane protein